MTNIVRLALIGVSILALTSPVMARTVAKIDRMTCNQSSLPGWQCTAPASLRERAYLREREQEQLAPAYGWNGDAGLDRESSPFGAAVVERNYSRTP
jgi:hypothetical protein